MVRSDHFDRGQHLPVTLPGAWFVISDPVKCVKSTVARAPSLCNCTEPTHRDRPGPDDPGPAAGLRQRPRGIRLRGFPRRSITGAVLLLAAGGIVVAGWYNNGAACLGIVCALALAATVLRAVP